MREDLLLLARAERPDFLTLESVELRDLTGEIHRKATMLCGREWRLEEAADGMIRADAQRLTQAMMQLAQNACQHTPDGALVRIGSRIEGGQLTLWVHDSGKGLNPRDADHVFERYTRGVDRPAGSGLGLGLSIVAAIAGAHGGRARLAQEVREGARFEIIIPAQPVAKPVAAALRSQLAG